MAKDKKKVVKKKSAQKKVANQANKKINAKKTVKNTVKKSVSKKAAQKLKPKKAKIQMTAKTQKPSSSRAVSGLKWEHLIQPVRDRVVVERIGESEKTPGGIIIPTSASERPLRGRVVAIGNGSADKKGRLRPLDVKVGDEVLFSKYAGADVQLAGHELLILTESEILGIVS